MPSVTVNLFALCINYFRLWTTLCTLFELPTALLEYLNLLQGLLPHPPHPPVAMPDY